MDHRFIPAGSQLRLFGRDRGVKCRIHHRFDTSGGHRELAAARWLRERLAHHGIGSVESTDPDRHTDLRRGFHRHRSDTRANHDQRPNGSYGQPDSKSLHSSAGIGAGDTVGPSSIGVGTNVTASGADSSAFGYGTTASGAYSFAAGIATTAQAYDSVVLGAYNVPSGNATNWIIHGSPLHDRQRYRQHQPVNRPDRSKEWKRRHRRPESGDATWYL